MLSIDLELLHLQHAEADARQQFARMRMNVRDASIIGHAKDLWNEAQAAVVKFQDLHPLNDNSRRD